MNRLVNDLIRRGYLKTDLVIEAFSEISRVEFVREEFIGQAFSDIALPIGYGQTISQPSTVAFMLKLLKLERGQNILDIGSGSGWTVALLCYITGRHGRVTAVEIKGSLKEYGEINVNKFHFLRENGERIAEFYLRDGSDGLPENAPYDRILVSAFSDSIPEKLKDQLKIGGVMVMPIGNSIWRLEKKSEKEYITQKYPGFSFVPLIS
jgi:protein-L-isoaspartate(D-aspartate) O-methyltransferase